MGNHLVNFVDVLGDRENIKRFYKELRGEGNKIFDFEKLIKMLNAVTRFSNTELVEHYKKQYENWGKSSFYGDTKKFHSHPNILSYKFYDTGIVPFDLYYFLIEKYSSLIFDIFIWEPTQDLGFIINGVYGHYTKYTYESLEHRKLNNDEGLWFTFRHDYIKGKNNILEAIVFKGTKPIYPLNSESTKKYNFLSDHFTIFADTDEDIVSLGKIRDYLFENDNNLFKPEIKFKPKELNLDDDSNKRSARDIINDCLLHFIKNDIDKGSELYAKTKCLIKNIYEPEERILLAATTDDDKDKSLNSAETKSLPATASEDMSDDDLLAELDKL